MTVNVTVESSPSSLHPAPPDVTTEQLLALPATWFNLEAVIHHLWGESRCGRYNKQKWAAGHSLMKRVRDREA